MLNLIQVELFWYSQHLPWTEISCCDLLTIYAKKEQHLICAVGTGCSGKTVISCFTESCRLRQTRSWAKRACMTHQKITTKETNFTKMRLFYSLPYQQDREGSSQESRLRPGSGWCQRDMETPILVSGQGDSSIRWDTERVSLLLQLSRKWNTLIYNSQHETTL